MLVMNVPVHILHRGLSVQAAQIRKAWSEVWATERACLPYHFAGLIAASGAA
jgi:hypothetical protein